MQGSCEPPEPPEEIQRQPGGTKPCIAKPTGPRGAPLGGTSPGKLQAWGLLVLTAVPAPAREVCWCPGDGRNRFWEIARKQSTPRGRQAYQAGSRLSEKLAKIRDFVGKLLPGMTWENGNTSFLWGRNAHRSHLRGISVPVAWRGQRAGRSHRKFRLVGTPRENPKDMEEEGACCLHQCCQSLGCQGAWPQPGGCPQWDTVPLPEGSHGTRCRAAPSWGQSWGHVRGHQMCWGGMGTW